MQSSFSMIRAIAALSTIGVSTLIWAEPQKVIEFKKVEDKVIELTNGETYGLGQNLRDSVIAKLKEKNLIQSKSPKTLQDKFTPRSGFFSEYFNRNDAPYEIPNIPFDSGTIKLEVKELNYTTGERGDRQFFGFSKDFSNPWNSGQYKNEFPARTLIQNQTWFGRRYNTLGGYYIHNYTGMELGGGFNINAVIFGLGFRMNRFHAESGLELTMEYNGRTITKNLNLTGDGAYVGINGSYFQYFAEIEVTRKSAMQQVLNSAIDSIANHITKEIYQMPYFAKIHTIDGSNIAITSGSDQNLQVGDLFYGLVNRTGNTNIFRVVSVYNTMSLVLQMAGEDDFQEGDMIQYAHSMAEVPNVPVGGDLSVMRANVAKMKGPEQRDSVGLDLGFMKIDYLPAGYNHIDNRPWWKKAVDGVVNLVLLVYRTYRFFQYDQPYQGPSEIAINNGWNTLAFKPETNCDVNKDDFWKTTDDTCKQYEDPMEMKDAFWGNLISDYTKEEKLWALRKVQANEAWKITTGKNGLVAIVDTGVDYNHNDLRDNMFMDGSRLDFVSMDTRPYDDNHHGTEVASLVAGNAMSYTGTGVYGIAPNSQILPIKIFNPWGITNSALIYEGIKKAADTAPIILLPWTTTRESEAIRLGLAYAHKKGALVIVPAGDGGNKLIEPKIYPAFYTNSYNNIIIVSASDQNDKISTVWGAYSNYDKELVHIAAPGVDMIVGSPRGKYHKMTSTDYAAAYVAGTAALVKSKFPNLTAKEIKKKILDSADKISGLADYVQYGRRLNTFKAVQ